MSAESGPVFVEKRTYRRRRLVDAARLLPLLGVALVCIPLLWTGPGATPTPTTHVMLYLFGVWLLLTAVSGVVSRHLKRTDDTGSKNTVGVAGSE